MFARFRKPTSKKHSYRLNLVPLESRDVPATWHVQMLSSNPGSTDATITETLVVGTANVTAPTANDAVSLAITGNVVVAYSGQTHTYTFGPTSTSGTGAAFRIVGSGSNTELQLEDLAGMPGATPDYDYNDHTWSLNVAQTAANGDPLPEVGIEAIDPTAAEAKSPPGTSTGLFRVSRSGSTTDALTAYVRIETTAGSATNKDDYSELVLDTVTYTTGGGSTTENLYQVTFAPNETYVTIPIVPIDDILPESTESVQLRVVGIDGKYVASTNKYAVAELLLADNDPFLAPVQKVYFGEGDLVAQPGSNAGLYVFKRTVADSYLTVNYTVGSTASGYTLSGGYGGNTSATFLPGISEVSVNLTMNTNGPPPTSGPVTVTITPSANYEIIGSPSNTVEIYSIGGPEPWINVFRRVDPVGNTLNEGGSKGQFVVSRYYAYPNGPPPQSIPTPPPLPDFALGGTARAGLDYIATKQATLRVLPAIASSMVFVDGYEVEITPLEDSAYDGGEWVDFALIPNEQSIVPVTEGSTPSFVTLPISDAGTPPQTVISIVAPDPNASELATSSGMYRIMRNDVNLPQTLTINYAFDPTGLTDPATFYDDYTITSSAGGLASSGSITFPAGVAMIEVKLTPVDDSKLENDELAQLKLLSGSAYVVDATKSKALILIVDKVRKPKGQLDIVDSNGTVVEDDQEETPGGWVSVNNDNDNYNFVGNEVTSLVHLLDKDENAKIVEENDLIRITANALVVPPGMAGKFTLEWTSTKIHIWKTPSKNGAVASGVEVATDIRSNYWVEGLGISSSMAAEEIALKWTDAAAGAVPQEMDKVNFTVYEVLGAMNVPGHSIYTYEARTPFGSEQQASFTGLSGSTIVHSTYDDMVYLTTTARIKWAGGPIVGKYRVTPSSSPNFFVDREVNVVEVSFAQVQGPNNRLSYGGPPTQYENFPQFIKSSPGTAIIANLQISKMQGPAVGGSMRGVRFIEVGMIQNLAVTKDHSDYDGFTIPKRRLGSLESNKMWLDAYIKNPGASTLPWVDSNSKVSITSLYYQVFDPAAGEVIENIDLDFTDRPVIKATDTMALTIEGVTKLPDRFAIRLDLNLYCAVHTQEAILDSDKVFTQREKASWYFDGSGTLNAGVWIKPDTAKSNGDKSFTEVINGDVVPVTTGDTANAVLGTQTWSTVDQ